MVLNETLPKLGVEYVIQMQFSSLLFEYYLSTIYRLLQSLLDVICCCIQKAIFFYQLLFLMRLVHQGSPSHAALAQRLTDISLITLATLRLTSCWFTRHAWILKTFRTSAGRSCRRNVWTHGTASRSFESRERFGQSESLVCSQRVFFLSLFAYEFVWGIAGLFSFRMLAIARLLSDVFCKYPVRLAITSRSKWRKPLSRANWCKVLSWGWKH